MALVGLSLDKVEAYIPDLDPAKKDDPEHATVFELGTLDAYLLARIQDDMSTISSKGDDQEAVVHMNLKGVAIEACRFAIKGWQRWTDEHGNEIPFETASTFVKGRKYQAVKRELMERFPLPLIEELYGQIRRINRMSEEDEKN